MNNIFVYSLDGRMIIINIDMITGIVEKAGGGFEVYTVDDSAFEVPYCYMKLLAEKLGVDLA